MSIVLLREFLLCYNPVRRNKKLAPQVRDLQALIAQQTAALQPQQDLLDQSITANATSGAAQETGLGAQKDTAFKQIEQTGQNKGMFFSGFSPDEQAKYTAGTYLPALAQLQATIASTRSNLLGKKADLNMSAFDKANAQHENDLQTLADWNKLTEQERFNASEADKQRVFQAQQNASDRAASAAASYAKSQADAPPPLATGLAQLFTGYVGAKQGGTPYYTENTIVPQLMAAYNLSHDAALKAAYNFRKQTFKE
jgi:hypothetical protein